MGKSGSETMEPEGVFDLGVRATVVARNAGEALAKSFATGGVTDINAVEAFNLSSAAALNPYAAFRGMGMDFSAFDVPREDTRRFFMRRWVDVNERAAYDNARRYAEAQAAAKEEAMLADSARAMGVSVREARAALVLGDRSFFRKADEAIVYG